jgi:hypothetical protein
MELLESEKKQISQKMGDPAFYQTPEASASIRRFELIEQELGELLERWTTDQELLEEAMQQVSD